MNISNALAQRIMDVFLGSDLETRSISTENLGSLLHEMGTIRNLLLMENASLTSEFELECNCNFCTDPTYESYTVEEEIELIRGKKVFIDESIDNEKRKCKRIHNIESAMRSIMNQIAPDDKITQHAEKLQGIEHENFMTFILVKIKIL